MRDSFYQAFDLSHRKLEKAIIDETIALFEGYNVRQIELNTTNVFRTILNLFVYDGYNEDGSERVVEKIITRVEYGEYVDKDGDLTEGLRMFTDANTYYTLNECADSLAILSIYGVIWENFYWLNEKKKLEELRKEVKKLEKLLGEN